MIEAFPSPLASSLNENICTDRESEGEKSVQRAWINKIVFVFDISLVYVTVKRITEKLPWLFKSKFILFCLAKGSFIYTSSSPLIFINDFHLHSMFCFVNSLELLFCHGLGLESIIIKVMVIGKFQREKSRTWKEQKSRDILK